MKIVEQSYVLGTKIGLAGFRFVINSHISYQSLPQKMRRLQKWNHEKCSIGFMLAYVDLCCFMPTYVDLCRFEGFIDFRFVRLFRLCIVFILLRFSATFGDFHILQIVTHFKYFSYISHLSGISSLSEFLDFVDFQNDHIMIWNIVFRKQRYLKHSDLKAKPFET